ncbi:hypothetical protein OEZ85_013478 [Tetradesmus obliquus]|uniref:Uncharacterized protein n=1 Tax=Tetradesmus obliquus TaxID=3088 RepID=A0ABY8URE4_TETOB|nr:hypothetical protein OEZ85_013478 [Tetradesmus obliquus]
MGWGPEPAYPTVATGTPFCILPITTLYCAVDTRSGFVAGLQFGNRAGYRLKDVPIPGRSPVWDLRSVCSSGPFSKYAPLSLIETIQQTAWDMTNVTDPSFPRNASGQPILAYYYPYGGLITQMIVLKAINPYGPSYGSIPAVIFRYFSAEGSGFAVCGNNLYAQAYLNPFNATPPPPTTPQLMAQFVNPRSAEEPPRFLSNFGGECSTRGYGYLGGDPVAQSYYHVKWFNRPCFAPVQNITQGAITPPEKRPEVAYDWTVPYTPCRWDKQQAKQGGSVTFDCARGGAAVMTGKYGVIVEKPDGEKVEAVPGEGGQMVEKQFSGVAYEGSGEGAGDAVMDDDVMSDDGW